MTSSVYHLHAPCGRWPRKAELLEGPATDECRHYHSDKPFPAIHVGDHLTAWVWKFPSQSYEDLVRDMRGRQVDPMQPIAVVDRVMHSIIDGEDSTTYQLVVFTRMYKPETK